MRFLRLLFSASGELNRVTYATVGVASFAIKHIIDVAIVAAFNVNSWPLFSFVSLFIYWEPFGVERDLRHLSVGDYRFLSALTAVAIPFVWIGVATTIKRLRALHWPAWLVFVFFIPLVNLVFFVLLIALPDAREIPAASETPSRVRHFLDRVMPVGMFASAAMTVAITSVFGIGAIVLSISFFQEYGWGVFAAVPVCQGILAAQLLGYRSPRSLFECLGVAELSVLLAGSLLLAVAMEGIVCIVMATPIAMFFAAIGAIVGYQIQRRATPRHATAALFVALLAAPLLIAAEASAPAEPPLLVVATSTTVHARPDVVWRSVVTFPQLPPPTEPVFRLGIAYPERARIVGSGIGAVRYCEFSTGAFVEPITTWDKPRMLAFAVIHNPQPMREWTPYAHITTPHLNGFLVAERGEFRLVPLAGGETLLIGTTWYRDKVWPNAYWRLWSDAIIHRIHLRVLDHIKLIAESH